MKPLIFLLLLAAIFADWLWEKRLGKTPKTPRP
jgi:hypothetical protein